MKKYLILNNKNFEINSKLKLHNNLKSLSWCYSKPSITKLRIYEDLLDFVSDLYLKNYYQVYDYGIASYNTFIFTFQIHFKDEKTNKEYLIHITPNHNYIKELN